MPICGGVFPVSFVELRDVWGRGNSARKPEGNQTLGVTELSSCTHLPGPFSNPPPFLPIPADAFEEEGLVFQPCSGTSLRRFDTHTPTRC